MAYIKLSSKTVLNIARELVVVAKRVNHQPLTTIYNIFCDNAAIAHKH